MSPCVCDGPGAALLGAAEHAVTPRQAAVTPRQAVVTPRRVYRGQGASLPP